MEKDYCCIECTVGIPFDRILYCSRSYRLDRDYRWGDIIKLDNEIYILTNPSIEFFEIKLVAGTTVRLIPLKFIGVIRSNRKLCLKNFKEVVETTKYYNLEGFDENMTEILGDYNYTRTTYRYIREHY